MLYDAIIGAYQEKHRRGWDTLYFAIDLHGTIIQRYTGDDINPYPLATEVLQLLSSIKDIVLVLFTSTSEENLKPFYRWCHEKGINFKYLNENPECESNKTGDFTKKFYYNVLIDDRAGFDPYKEWISVKNAIILTNRL